jgi:hypothetical protein
MNRFKRLGKIRQRSLRNVPPMSAPVSREMTGTARKRPREECHSAWKEEKKEDYAALWVARMTRGNVEARIAHIKAAVRSNEWWEGDASDLAIEAKMVDEFLIEYSDIDARDADRQRRVCAEYLAGV